MVVGVVEEDVVVPVDGPLPRKTYATPITAIIATPRPATTGVFNTRLARGLLFNSYVRRGKYPQTLQARENSIFQRTPRCLSGVESSELGLDAGMKNLEVWKKRGLRPVIPKVSRYAS
jgi:hypothetical protein